MPHLVAFLLEESHLDPDDGLLERRQRLFDVALLAAQQVGSDLLVEQLDLRRVGQCAEVAMEVVEGLEDRLVWNTVEGTRREEGRLLGLATPPPSPQCWV